MPFMPLRKKASHEAQGLGCTQCGRLDLVLHHYTSKGGIRQSGVINHPGEFRKKDLSKDQDFSPEAFCSFGCFDLHEARRIPEPRWKVKRPF